LLPKWVSPDFIGHAFIIAIRSRKIDIAHFLSIIDFDITEPVFVALPIKSVHVDGFYVKKWISPIFAAAMESDQQFLELALAHPRFDPSHPSVERVLFKVRFREQKVENGRD
jgi:hypothetical protein